MVPTEAQDVIIGFSTKNLLYILIIRFKGLRTYNILLFFYKD